MKIGRWEVAKKSSGFAVRKSWLCGSHPSPPPFCPHLADGAQNFLNVVARWLVHVYRIGLDRLWFAGVISKYWFFGPQSDYNIRWKPAMQLSPYNNFICGLIYDSDLIVKCDSDSALLVVASCDWSKCVCVHLNLSICTCTLTLATCTCCLSTWYKSGYHFRLTTDY